VKAPLATLQAKSYWLTATRNPNDVALGGFGGRAWGPEVASITPVFSLELWMENTIARRCYRFLFGASCLFFEVFDGENMAFGRAVG
jgi:hypothetical protein